MDKTGIGIFLFFGYCAVEPKKIRRMTQESAFVKGQGYPFIGEFTVLDICVALVWFLFFDHANVTARLASPHR
mgnify:CR=1 FL=1